jgi:hypothetical protein
MMTCTLPKSHSDSFCLFFLDSPFPSAPFWNEAVGFELGRL